MGDRNVRLWYASWVGWVERSETHQSPRLESLPQSAALQIAGGLERSADAVHTMNNVAKRPRLTCRKAMGFAALYPSYGLPCLRRAGGKQAERRNGCAKMHHGLRSVHPSARVE